MALTFTSDQRLILNSTLLLERRPSSVAVRASSKPSMDPWPVCTAIGPVSSIVAASLVLLVACLRLFSNVICASLEWDRSLYSGMTTLLTRLGNKLSQYCCCQLALPPGPTLAGDMFRLDPAKLCLSWYPLTSCGLITVKFCFCLLGCLARWTLILD